MGRLFLSAFPLPFCSPSGLGLCVCVFEGGCNLPQGVERTDLAEIVQCCSLLCVTVECVRVCIRMCVYARERKENERMRKSKRGRGTC